jgi:membrane fusion protein, multidrug efflux system
MHPILSVRFLRVTRNAPCLPAVLMTLAALGYAAPAEPRPVPVRTHRVEYSHDALPVHTVGILSRRNEANLSFKVTGLVDDVLVRAGDQVKAGQVLARLRLDEIEGQVTQARSAVEKAERDRARAVRLYEQGGATLESVQNTESALQAALGNLQIAEFNLRYSVVTAAKNGRVLRRFVEPGEFVPSGRAVVSFAADDEGWLVRAGLAQRELSRIAIGDVARVGNIEGVVTQIAEAADPTTRTVEVEIALSSAPANARSGIIMPLILYPQPVAERPKIAASALVEGEGRTASIFLLDDNGRRARRVDVEIEALFGPHAYLVTELPRNGIVVVQGADFLRDGTFVTAVETGRPVASSRSHSEDSTGSRAQPTTMGQAHAAR